MKRLVTSASSLIIAHDLPPRMELERERVLREMAGELMEWELMGYEVKTEPWVGIYGGTHDTLGVFIVTQGPWTVRLGIVSGGSLYIVWGEKLNVPGMHFCDLYPFLDDALTVVRERVKAHK